MMAYVARFGWIALFAAGGDVGRAVAAAARPGRRRRRQLVRGGTVCRLAARVADPGGDGAVRRGAVVDRSPRDRPAPPAAAADAHPADDDLGSHAPLRRDDRGALADRAAMVDRRGNHCGGRLLTLRASKPHDAASRCAMRGSVVDAALPSLLARLRPDRNPKQSGARPAPARRRSFIRARSRIRRAGRHVLRHRPHRPRAAARPHWQLPHRVADAAITAGQAGGRLRRAGRQRVRPRHALSPRDGLHAKRRKLREWGR